MTHYMVICPGLPERWTVGFPHDKPTSVMTDAVADYCIQKIRVLNLRRWESFKDSEPTIIPVDENTTDISWGPDRYLVRHLPKSEQP